MVFRLLRPDAERAWKHPEILRRFSRYRGIIEGTRIARYLLAKSIKCSFNETNSLEDLLLEFKTKTKKFRDILRKEGEISELGNEKEHSYIALAERIANEYLKSCNFCERRCGANRSEGEKGFCLVPKDAFISSAFLHYGEESVLVPSGTIFFQGCNFACCFCQNYDISQAWKKRYPIEEVAQKVSGNTLANLAEKLCNNGALNINYVGGDPIPNIHVILNSLRYQSKNICQLWNSNFYLTEESLSLILDLMDFWLPDFKYGNNDCAKKYSGIENYYDVITRNLKIIHDVGSGEIIIRHLVMPNHVECCSIPILDYIAKEVPKCVVNIMAQYRPVYHAFNHTEINRRPTSEELQKVKQHAKLLGILFEPVS